MPKGCGVSWDLLRNLFPDRICDKYYTIYLYTKNNHIQAKPTKKRFVSIISISAIVWKKKKKNTFPKEVFNEIWLIIRDHEYINIAEIKIENFDSGGILEAKQFSRTLILIYANFFPVKQSVSMRVTITNNTGQQKIEAIVVKYAKNWGRAQWDPLGHLSVKLEKESCLYYFIYLIYITCIFTCTI